MKPSAQPAVFDPMRLPERKPMVDPRHILNGHPIPRGHYADQPYLVPTHDGGWLCAITTGAGEEGTHGQNVMTVKTFNQGQTWSAPVPIEPEGGPEASWGVPYVAPNGRALIFYVHNTDNLRELAADNPPYPDGITHRMDSHGYYVFRWSDDHGATWSQERIVIPVRAFEIDRRNPTGGKIRLFWNVGLPFEIDGALFLPIHKVGGMGLGWFTSSEGALLRSDDLLWIENPPEARWTTLPEGECGIRSPKGGGPIAEEHSFVTLSDGSIFTVFRTIDGHPGCSYSRDAGRTWEPSQYLRYATGSLIKHPRAANFVWKRQDGSFLYFFHNHGGKPLREHPEARAEAYNHRNPTWFACGWEEETPHGRVIKWSEPEIGLYDDDCMIRISYPGFIEENGRIFLTETQKQEARLHEIPPHLVAALSPDSNHRLAALRKLRPIAEWNASYGSPGIAMPDLPPFVVRDPHPPYGSLRTREGFAMEVVFPLQACGDGEILMDNFGPDGSLLRAEITSRRTLHLRLSDGQSEVSWESDAIPASDAATHAVINIDGGAGIILFVINGCLCDGGDSRQFGWGRISPQFQNRYSGRELAIGQTVQNIRIYPRFLTTAEAVELSREFERKNPEQPLMAVCA